MKLRQKKVLLTWISADICGHLSETEKAPNPQVASQHQDHQGAALEDVPDAADDLHLDLLQLVPLHPLLRRLDLLRGGADLVPDCRTLVLVGCLVQLLQLVFDGLPLLEAVQAFLASECKRGCGRTMYFKICG